MDSDWWIKIARDCDAKKESQPSTSGCMCVRPIKQHQGREVTNKKVALFEGQNIYLAPWRKPYVVAHPSLGHSQQQWWRGRHFGEWRISIMDLHTRREFSLQKTGFFWFCFYLCCSHGEADGLLFGWLLFKSFTSGKELSTHCHCCLRLRQWQRFTHNWWWSMKCGFIGVLVRAMKYCSFYHDWHDLLTFSDSDLVTGKP